VAPVSAHDIRSQAWHSLWELRPRHEVPATTRLLLASLVAIALALGLMTFVAVFGRIDRPGWWWASLLPNIVICLCIVSILITAATHSHKSPPSVRADRRRPVA